MLVCSCFDRVCIFESPRAPSGFRIPFSPAGRTSYLGRVGRDVADAELIGESERNLRVGRGRAIERRRGGTHRSAPGYAPERATGRIVMHHRNAPHRSGFTHLALAALLGLALVGLTQCRSVSDAVTGVDFSRTTATTLSHRNSCVRDCKHQYREALRDESRQFCKELRACDRDRKCERQAWADHKDRVDEIRDARKECKKGCYNEGGGGGGHDHDGDKGDD